MKGTKFDPSVFISIFRRRGATSEATGVLSSIDENRRRFIELKINDFSNEEPVIGGCLSEELWFAITKNHLYIGKAKETNEVDLNCIVEVKVDLKKIQEAGSSLRKWEEILITTSSGDMLALNVEAGLPMGGVWNVLLHVTDRNQRR